MQEKGNHLGNVLTTISDRRYGVTGSNTALIDYYTAVILSSSDYYAGGFSMPGRGYKGSGYRYGFNGKEKDGEINGDYDYGARLYNSRIGRFWSVDALVATYPFYSPYAFASNSPILNFDIDGNETAVELNETESTRYGFIGEPWGIFGPTTKKIILTPRQAASLTRIKKATDVASSVFRVASNPYVLLTALLTCVPAHELNGGENAWLKQQKDNQDKYYRKVYLESLEESGTASAEQVEELEKLTQELDGIYGKFDKNRPSWSQTEKDASILLGSEYKQQQSFINGKKVAYGEKGSVRPDNFNYEKNESVEVKNYTLNAKGTNRLVRNVTGQINYRYAHLPANATQRVIVDIRGQNVTRAQWDKIVQRIENKVKDKSKVKIERLGALSD